MNTISILTKGTLYEYRQKVIDSIVNKVSLQKHLHTYEGNTGINYAEPEFTGKYLDLCMKIYRDLKCEKSLNNGEMVINSIIKNQRTDGYLGCLDNGLEQKAFSIWNQAFTILGLVSAYITTGNADIINVATKCADYVMKPFYYDNHDILDSTNYGTQHISILYPLCLLFEISKNKKIKDYIFFIVDAIKNSDLNFFDSTDILKLRSRKGIENFVVILGIIEYGKIFGDEQAFIGAEKYWQQINDTQIRNTGNGTIKEMWTENGNACMLLNGDKKPNETCVAVGWIELSLALFYHNQDVKYLDAIDKTLYNHILASISDDGSDFAYYQPNFGNRVGKTAEDMYKCCRYRGFTLFTYMNNMLFYEDSNCIIPMIYASCKHSSHDVIAELNTDYPYDPNIFINITSRTNKKLKIRIPKNCAFLKIKINNTEKTLKPNNGYLDINLEKDLHYNIEIYMKNLVIFENGNIDNMDYVSVNYGPILLASENMQENEKIVFPLDLIKTDPVNPHKIGFTATGFLKGSKTKITLCEYSSADNYNVWLPISKTL